MTLPGDVRPPTLERPPGDRYRTATPVPVVARPRMARGISFGLVALLIVATASALLRSILGLTTGIIAFAAVGGWAIGASVRVGAWGGRPHRPAAGPTIAGATLGGVCWVASLVGAWMVAMAILPGSSRTLSDRLVTTPFLDWLGPQLELADLLDLLLFVTLGWFGARSAATLE